MPDILAVDFETATEDGASACSVAAVKFVDGRETEYFSSLIRPNGNPFNMFTKKHGITNEHTKYAPSFPEVWEHVNDMIDSDTLVVAHNAAFDIGRVLRESVELYGYIPSSFRYTCTVNMSRTITPQYKSHNLSAIAKRYGLDLQHHDALSDARACGHLYYVLNGMTSRNADDIDGVGVRWFIPFQSMPHVPKDDKDVDLDEQKFECLRLKKGGYGKFDGEMMTFHDAVSHYNMLNANVWKKGLTQEDHMYWIAYRNGPRDQDNGIVGLITRYFG